MRRLSAVLLALIIACLSGAAHAAGHTAVPETAPAGENAVIREFTFVADTPDFSYDAPQQITEDGTLYFYRDIRYEVIGEEPVVEIEERTFTHEEALTGLSKKDDGKFPQEVAVDEEGFTGKIPRKVVAWTNQAKAGGKTVYTAGVGLGDQADVPVPAGEREVVYKDPVSGKDVFAVFPLKEVKKTVDYRWLDNHVATLRLHEGDLLDITGASPAWQGKENQLLALMRLDPQKYIIRSARWLGEAMDGARTVEFSMDRYAARFVAVYEGEVRGPETVTYDGKAVYEGVLYNDIVVGTEYAVKAIVTYEAPTVTATASPAPAATPEATPEPETEPEPSAPAFPVAAVVAAPLLIAAAVFVFFWKRNRNQQEDA